MEIGALRKTIEGEHKQVVVTTTQQAERLQEYLDVFDSSWQLSDIDMSDINAAGDEYVHRAFWNAKLDEE